MAPENPSRKPRNWTAIILVLAALGGIGAFLWLRAESTGVDGFQPTVALEAFVVNLGGSSQRAYLRIGISLGLAHPLPRNQPEAMPTAMVRDTILSVLAMAQSDELLKADGKSQLKEELLKALQERVPQLGIENVYFTEFLVQM